MPSLSQSCVSPSSDSSSIDLSEPPQSEAGILPAAITQPGPVRTATLSGLAALLVVGGVYGTWFFAHPASRLKRRLRKVGPLLGDESAQVLKDDYKELYGLYLKLSENRKKNFYSKISKVREKIEEQLKAQKRVEQLLSRSSEGDLKEQRKTYLDLYKEYQKLPAKAQKEYYKQIVDLREGLENERKNRKL